MKVTWNWLNEFVDLDGLALEDLEHRLASQGLHIEEVFRPSDRIKEVYIGYIIRVEKHPDADRLQVCHVDMGEKGTLQIVTAAPNVREKAFVPVAVEGAVLHSGMVIKKAKLRGVESRGMFCSLEELGLEEHSEGIFLMEESPEPVRGAPALPYFGLDDTVIDFEITSNRPDCLSVRGIAREVAMAAGRPLKTPPLQIRENNTAVTDKIGVEVKDSAKCLRYTARVIQGVSVKESPLFVRCRLALVGLRSINNIVDATNYVMWEYGLPLHAFDRSGVSGGKIVVRKASAGEGFDTLAGEHLQLTDEDLLIADTKRGIALAGVIGGENSEITPETKDVVLEAALFDPVSIRMTAKRHNQKTDSSYRFERGMDFEAVETSSQRAASLIALWGGGELCRGMADEKSTSFDPRRALSLRVSQIPRHLGISLSQDEVSLLFKKLDYDIIEEREGLISLSVPSGRFWDISREIDLIEEIARFYGYDKIPESLPLLKMRKGKSDKRTLFCRETEMILLSNGFYECYLYPFISEELMKKIGYEPGDRPRVVNPLNRDMEYMNPEPLLGLVKVAETNLKRGAGAVRLYEWGKSYPSFEGEAETLSFLCAGFEPRTVYSPGHELGYFDAKAIIEGLLEKAGCREAERRESRRPVWAPQSGFVYTLNGEEVLEIGMLRKDLADIFDIRQEVWGGYARTGALAERFQPGRSFVPFSPFPPVYFDLAFVVDSSLPAGELEKEIVEQGGTLLEECRLFDRYEGDRLPSDKKSLAFSLTFRSQERTLTEKEIDGIIQKIVARMKKVFHAELR